MIKDIHLFFEQSGTFKNEFKKLGFNAYDYDILNDFNETDYIIDLYSEINKSYMGCESIFDRIDKDDLIMAFFPCTRFEQQILLWFRGEAMQQKNWTLEKKLEKDLSLHSELSKNYEIITKLVIVCLRKQLKLIIENPYSEQHYLSIQCGATGESVYLSSSPIRILLALYSIETAQLPTYIQSKQRSFPQCVTLFPALMTLMPLSLGVAESLRFVG